MRSFLLLTSLIFVVSCDSNTAGKGPGLGAALDDAPKTRLVSVYLQAQPNNGFIPVYADRIIAAEPMTLVPKIRAQGKAIVQDIDTIIVGSSCDQLRSDHPQLLSCEEVDAVDFKYGKTESTVTTDAEGFAALYLGEHEKYRISVKSYATREDPHCFWGGSEVLEATASSLAIPLHVFCE